MSNSASQINANAKAAGSFYKVGLGTAVGASALLEQRITVLAEANTDKQSDAAQDNGELEPITSKAVAEVYGYGSPAHLTAIALIDNLSVGVSTKFLFVPEAGVCTATSYELAGTGTAVTKTGVLTLNFNGTYLPITLTSGDTLAEALVVIKTAINAQANFSSSVATVTPTTTIDIATKWKGVSSIGFQLSQYANTCTGLTFALTKTDGTGEVVPTTQLAKIQNDWYPHVLNCLGDGTAGAILDAFETANGTFAAGTAKCSPVNMTPFRAWTGTHTSVLATLQAVTSSRLDEETNVYIPFPSAQEFPFINAANALGIFVNKSNGDPKQDILEDVLSLSTIPEDKDVGDIINYDFRDGLVGDGCSTVNVKEGNYYAGDIITTYHPSGETDPIFQYVRDNMLIFNLIYAFKQFNARQKNKTIAPNALPSAQITSPALYKAGILNEVIKPYVNAGYLADFDYAKDNIDVGINPTNAGRFDVLAPNLITSLLRIVANEVQVNKYYNS